MAAKAGGGGAKRSDLLAHLVEVLRDASRGLTSVVEKRMFGCDAMFAAGNIYGLVWKHGRIGVRLPDLTAYTQLMAMPGADPWKAGPMVMSHWVLVPETFHDHVDALVPWVKRAHALAHLKPAAPAKKPAVKRSVAKSGAKKRAAPRKAAAKKK